MKYAFSIIFLFLLFISTDLAGQQREKQEVDAARVHAEMAGEIEQFEYEVTRLKAAVEDGDQSSVDAMVLVLRERMETLTRKTSSFRKQKSGLVKKAQKADFTLLRSEQGISLPTLRIFEDFSDILNKELKACLEFCQLTKD